jgi:hemin uptake protein HemP
MSVERQKEPGEEAREIAPRAADAADDPASSPLRMVDSHEVMAGRRLILIRHGTEQYRLQITRKGKLILTK